MKEALKKEVYVVADRFVSELVQLEKSAEAKENNVDVKLLKLEDDRKTLKAEAEDIQRLEEANKAAIQSEKEKIKEVQTQVNGEIRVYKTLINKAEKAGIAADKALEDAEMEREIAVAAKDKIKEAKKELNEKIEEVKDQQGLISAEVTQLTERERLVAKREDAVAKNEANIISKTEELVERELDIKVSEKDIRTERKKLKLKG